MAKKKEPYPIVRLDATTYSEFMRQFREIKEELKKLRIEVRKK